MTMSSLFSTQYKKTNVVSRPTTSASSSSSSSFMSTPRLIVVLLMILVVIEVLRSIAMMHNQLSLSGMYPNNNNTDTDTDTGGIYHHLASFGVSTSLAACDNPSQKTTTTSRHKTTSTTIAYATTITAYDENSNSVLLDRAAVLHQSIRQAHSHSKYGYHMYAFVHVDAALAKPFLERLGYRVQLQETPFNVSSIENEQLRTAQNNGCCGAKEYLKLYSYLLLDYKVVVHLDLDTLVLKPMDQLFDVMIGTDAAEHDAAVRQQFAQESSMWYKTRNTTSPETSSSSIWPQQLDFVFTRDYNMVTPPSKQVRQMGVQGGFLVVRPNRQDFDNMIRLVVTGGDGYTISEGWGAGKVINGKENSDNSEKEHFAVGGFYGAGTIQGLASYYYGRNIQPVSRAVELNRCYYNTMVDNPHAFNEGLNQTLCTTLESTCENCRHTPIEKIYTAHFTVCGKPDWCDKKDPNDERKGGKLCMELFRKWHTVRLSLEREWMQQYENYIPELAHVNASESQDSYRRSFFQGHCRQNGQYIPLRFPVTTETATTLIR